MASSPFGSNAVPGMTMGLIIRVSVFCNLPVADNLVVREVMDYSLRHLHASMRLVQRIPVELEKFLLSVHDVLSAQQKQAEDEASA